MNAQDDYARGALAQMPGRDGDREARLRELFYFDAVGAPLHRGDRYFYTRKHADKEKTVVYWKQGEDGAEHVLFDPNAWSERRQQGPARLVAELGRQARRVRGQRAQLRRDRRCT